MPRIERLEVECPPDARKVIRDEENKMLAHLVIRIDDSECDLHDPHDLCEVLALMSDNPLVWCSDHVRGQIEQHADAARIEPAFLKVYADEGQAALSYSDGSVGPVKAFHDYTSFSHDFNDFLERLRTPGFVAVNSLSMLILRSIGTVFEWDLPLAEHFLHQYREAKARLDQKLIMDLFAVRYGQMDSEKIKTDNSPAYPFLHLEKKLFLQYPDD